MLPQILSIAATDQVSRCIIYDKAFDKNVHTDDFLWLFGKTMDDGASHESAVMRRLAPTANDVHEIGCGIASVQNTARGEPPAGPKRKYYCGFRTALFGNLPTHGDGYYFTITHSPEGDIYSHVDVALTVTVEGRNAKAVRRTDAGLALAEQFGAPVPHVCACDAEDKLHPLSQWGPECLTGPNGGRWPEMFANLTHELPANDDVSITFVPAGLLAAPDSND